MHLEIFNMKINIPDLGTKLILQEPCTITLYDEYRNTLHKSYGKKGNLIVELPKGLLLKVDRIYIRKGSSSYSSVTFTIPKVVTKKDKLDFPDNVIMGGTKFWIKLHEVNSMNTEPLEYNKETSIVFMDFYKKLESDLSKKYNMRDCTKSLQFVNKLLGPGNTVNTLLTKDDIDLFMYKFCMKIEDPKYSKESLSIDCRNDIIQLSKQYLRDYKLTMIGI